MHAQEEWRLFLGVLFYPFLCWGDSEEDELENRQWLVERDRISWKLSRRVGIHTDRLVAGGQAGVHVKVMPQQGLLEGIHGLVMM